MTPRDIAMKTLRALKRIDEAQTVEDRQSERDNAGLMTDEQFLAMAGRRRWREDWDAYLRRWMPDRGWRWDAAGVPELAGHLAAGARNAEETETSTYVGDDLQGARYIDRYIEAAERCATPQQFRPSDFLRR